MIFQGNHPLTMDAKGRMMIPARYRDALLSTVNGEMTFTLNFGQCLLVYPRPQWAEKREELMELPHKFIHAKRMFLGNAFDVDIDKAGRVLIPTQLREQAGLEKDVVLVGMGRYFELWDAQKYHAVQAEAMVNSDIDDLGDFSL